MAKWSKKLESEKSWLIDKKKIEENDFILIASSYKLNLVDNQLHREPEKNTAELKKRTKICQRSLKIYIILYPNSDYGQPLKCSIFYKI